MVGQHVGQRAVCDTGFVLNCRHSGSAYLTSCCSPVNVSSAMKAFAAKLNDYVDIVMGETDTSSGAQANGIDVQCDRCLKWRRLPDTVDEDTLPEKWYCRNNPDVNYK
ncbi:MORC family CW-type Zinc finger protein 3 [Plakobranchus ocellatus]|uniref:MORC family CW-type Zinc finger protein 3 n=1 Tax=Plakobranchus ocellatus TaxID=259542 RepID=A0AAV4B8R1_9GAST|nr:MORC family CW-type Zinc finger protein 3 [Plakobranchus ocellatus]